ncbi:MAG: hypothetical protein ACRCZF_00080, partial [Gemmataceae bacterium]
MSLWWLHQLAGYDIAYPNHSSPVPRRGDAGTFSGGGVGVEVVGRVAKQFGSRGFYAAVSVLFTPGNERRVGLSPAAEDVWYRSQGWLAGATTGVSLGLDLAGATGEC